MNKIELQNRTLQFAVSIYKIIDQLPYKKINLSIYSQILRSTSSVGSNYRAACRAKSTKDFTYKISVVLEEIDESMYWLEYLEATGIANGLDLAECKSESNQLTAIFASILKTLRENELKRSVL